MRRTITVSLAAAVLSGAVLSDAVLAAVATAQEPTLDLPAEIDRIVALPTPDERRIAAKALSKRPGVNVETVLAALRVPPRRLPAEPGAHVERITISLGTTSSSSTRVTTRVHTYVPTSYEPAAAAPLIFALHGTGGSGAMPLASWRGVAEELGAIVVAPDDAGENAGYTFSPRERAVGLAALRWARRRFHVDPNRIHVTGVSRGGHMSWDLALRHPNLFASVAPMIGGPRLNFAKGQNNTRFVENVAHLPIRDLQGSKDDARLLANLHMVFERLSELKAPDAELIEFPERGHDFDLSAVDWPLFFGEARRDPTPERVVILGDDAGYRAHWAEITKVGRGITPNFRPRVDPAKWNALPEAEKRLFVAQQIEEKTARLAVRRTGVGTFEAKSRAVTSFRLLLRAEDFDPAESVAVRWNNKVVKRRVRPSALVLLTEFAERLDRSFLPVAEIRVPR